jgi:hypothetical protein
MEDAARELATIDAKRRASVLAPDDDSFDVRMAHDTGGEGAIVTDHKRDRFKLVPAVTSAFHDWLFEKREDLARELEPKHTVAPAAERKDVIARAAEGGVLAPKNDYDTVATRLRHVPRVKVSVKPTVRDAAEVPQPSWHTVDEAAPAATPEPQPSTPQQFVPRPAPVPHLEDEPKPEPKPVPPPTPPVPPPPPPAVEAAPVLRNETPAPVRTPAAPVPTVSRPRRVLPYALIGIALLATLAGSGVVYLVAHRVSGTPAPSQPIAMLPDHGVPVALSTSRDAFIAAIADAVQGADRTGISWLVPMNENGTPADAARVLATLELHAPGAFTRSVSVLRFGSLSGVPFIVMTVPNYDTGLGGMLAWEDSIVPDFAPLFGAPISASKVPTATTTAATAPQFMDITHANRDLRVLYDENGTERVTYTFLDRTTIVITTTPGSIDEIAPAVQE